MALSRTPIECTSATLFGANIQNLLIWLYTQIYPKARQLGDLRIGKRVTGHIEITARILTASVEELVK